MADRRVDLLYGNDLFSGSSWSEKENRTDGVADGSTTFTSASANFVTSCVIVGDSVIIANRGTYTVVSVTDAHGLVLSANVAQEPNCTFKIVGCKESKADGVIPASPLNRLTSATAKFVTNGAAIGDFINIVTKGRFIIQSVDSETQVTLTTNAAAQGTGLTFYLGGAFKTLSAITAAGISTAGDNIRIVKSADPVSIGSAVWTNGSAVVTVGAGLTQAIDSCDGAWTGVGSGVVQSNPSATAKEGAAHLQFACTAVGSLQLAYKTISELNLSTFKYVCLFYRCTTAVPTQLRVDLCSDNGATSIVNSLTFDVTLGTTGTWIPLSLNNGTGLASSIKSVAIHKVDATAYTGNIFIDNIVACNDLRLSTLIGLNDGTTSGYGWYCIKSITGTTVTIAAIDAVGTTVERYQGSTVTATTYCRPTLRAPTTNTSGTTSYQSLTSNNGTVTNPVNLVGGYNPSNDTQDGETFIDGHARNGHCIQMVTTGAQNSYYTMSKVSGVRYGELFYCGGGSSPAYNCVLNMTDCYNAGCNYLKFASPGLFQNTDLRCIATHGYILGVGGTSGATQTYDCTWTTIAAFGDNASNSPFNAVLLTNCTIDGYRAKGYAYGIYIAGNKASFGNTFKDLVLSNNSVADIWAASAQLGVEQIRMFNCQLNSATPVVLGASSVNYINSMTDGGVANAFKVYKYYGLLVSDTSVIKTSARSQKMTPNSDSIKLESMEYFARIRTSPTVTAGVWVRKSKASTGDSADYNGNQPRLILKANRQAGFLTDQVIATASAAIGDWEYISGALNVPTGVEITGAEYYQMVVDCDGTAGFVNVDGFVNGVNGAPELITLLATPDKVFYAPSAAITVTGSVQANVSTFGTTIAVTINKKSDDSLISTLATTTYNLVEYTTATLNTIFGGAVTGTVPAAVDDYYVRVVISGGTPTFDPAITTMARRYGIAVNNTGTGSMIVICE